MLRLRSTCGGSETQSTMGYILIGDRFDVVWEKEKSVMAQMVQLEEADG